MTERRIDDQDFDFEADRRARLLIAERDIQRLHQKQDGIKEVVDEIRTEVQTLSQSLAVHKVQTGFIGLIVAAVVSGAAAIVQFVLKGNH